MASTADLATLGIGDFEPHLDAVFEMQSPGGMIPLKLANTAPAGQSRRAKRGVLAAEMGQPRCHFFVIRTPKAGRGA
jgi:hypothetical protein